MCIHQVDLEVFIVQNPSLYTAPSKINTENMKLIYPHHELGEIVSGGRYIVVYTADPLHIIESVRASLPVK